MSFIRVVCCAGAVLLAGCQSSPAPQSSSTQEMRFQQCDLEGMRAFNIARQYIVLKDSKERILSYVGKSESGQAVVNDLVARADAKAVKHHAEYATEKLFACAEREQLNIGKSKSIVQTCYARADIPFFMVSGKAATPNKVDAVAKVGNILKDRTVYPLKLIEATATTVYDVSPAPDAQKLMGTVFWSCVYNDEWNAK